MPRHRLLLADDHPLILEGLRRVLEPEFEVVGVAANGRQLVARVLELHPDAVLLDIGMPELNGIEAARQIKRVLPATKIIFITQVDDRAYARAAFQAQASAYLLKQSVVAELAIAVRESLAGRFYVSEALRGLLEGRFNPNYSPAALVGENLTPRQREVLQLVAEGKTAKDIAATLGISAKTVEFHKNGIMQELGLRTVAELTRYALEHGIIGKQSGSS
jgi:DNA-binding NarL/FixJ family response regulator